MFPQPDHLRLLNRKIALHRLGLKQSQVSSPETATRGSASRFAPTSASAAAAPNRSTATYRATA